VRDQFLGRDDEWELDGNGGLSPRRASPASHGRPWSFDGDGQLFRLVSEAPAPWYRAREAARNIS
jgi:hypothetical protein